MYQRVLHIVRKSNSKFSTLKTKLRPDLVTLAYKLLENNNNNIPKRSFVTEKFWDKKSKDLRIYEFDKTEFLDNTHIEEFLEKINLQEKYEITEAQRKFIDSIDNYSMPIIIAKEIEPEFKDTQANINLDDCSESEDMDFSSNSTATRVFRNKNPKVYTEEHVSFTRCFRSSDDEDMYIVMPKNKIIKKRSNLKEKFETAGILTGLVTVFSAETCIIFKSIRNIYQEIMKDKNNNKSQKSRV